MKYIMLINVKMPTIVGILTLISMVHVSTTSEGLRAKEDFIFQHFGFYQLSTKKKFDNLGARLTF